MDTEALKVERDAMLHDLSVISGQTNALIKRVTSSYNRIIRENIPHCSDEHCDNAGSVESHTCPVRVEVREDRTHCNCCADCLKLCMKHT